MTVEKYEEIKSKIDEAKETKARAEGVIDNIEKQWESYDIKSLEDAEKKLKSLQEEIKENNSRLGKLYSRLENLVDWDSL